MTIAHDDTPPGDHRRNHGHPPPRRNPVEELLLELFDAEELLQFVEHYAGPALTHRLPSADQSLQNLVYRTVGLFRRYGYLTDDLFDALEQERPRRAALIRSVQRRLNAAEGRAG